MVSASQVLRPQRESVKPGHWNTVFRRKRSIAKCSFCGNAFDYLEQTNSARVWRHAKEIIFMRKVRQMTLQKIADHFQCCISTVRSILRNPNKTLISPKRRPDRKFCSRECAGKSPITHQRKLPNAEMLQLIYVDGRLSIAEIARRYGVDNSTVSKGLDRAGISRRSRGRLSSCKVPGCGKPIFKLKRAANGTAFGVRCLKHERLWHAKRHRVYMRKIKGTPPEKWRVDDELPARERDGQIRCNQCSSFFSPKDLVLHKRTVHPIKAYWQ